MKTPLWVGHGRVGPLNGQSTQIAKTCAVFVRPFLQKVVPTKTQTSMDCQDLLRSAPQIHFFFIVLRCKQKSHNRSRSIPLPNPSPSDYIYILGNSKYIEREKYCYLDLVVLSKFAKWACFWWTYLQNYKIFILNESIKSPVNVLNLVFHTLLAIGSFSVVVIMFRYV